jgi:two-component system KDP operon response regulator KdpE
VEVTRRIREWSAIPIIVVSARGKDQDKVVALDAGADDYLTKPFSVSELLARVRVAMRHTAAANKDTGDPVFQVGDLTVDLARHQVTVGGKAIHLTRIEFRLLAALAKNAGRVMTHRQLLHQVWGPGTGDQSQYLRVYMNQLRHKIEPNADRNRRRLSACVGRMIGDARLAWARCNLQPCTVREAVWHLPPGKSTSSTRASLQTAGRGWVKRVGQPHSHLHQLSH